MKEVSGCLRWAQEVTQVWVVEQVVHASVREVHAMAIVNYVVAQELEAAAGEVGVSKEHALRQGLC